MAGYGFTDKAWKQASLPISKGGLGIPSAYARSKVSFVASVAQSWPLQKELLKNLYENPRSEWDSSLNDINNILTDRVVTLESIISLKNPQAMLSEFLIEKTYNVYLSNLNERDTARIKSCSMKHSGDFLLALPNPAFGLKMIPFEFSKAIRLRLGLSVFAQSKTCPKCKTCVLDVFGQHAQNCKYGGAPTLRHNKIRDLIFRKCQASLLAPRKEVRDLLDNTNEKPADVYIPSWLEDRPAAIDVTITNPLNMDIVGRSANQAGAAAAVRRAQKIAKYQEACAIKNITFIPFAMETFGGLADDAHKIIEKISSAFALHNGIDFLVAKKNFYDRLSVLIQKQNASTVAGFDVG